MSTQCDRRSQILVIPASSAQPSASRQARGIVQAIVADETDEQLTQNGSADTLAAQWHISNRYYEANVQLLTSRSSLLPPPEKRTTRAARNGVRSEQHRIKSRPNGTEIVNSNDIEDEAALDDQIRDVFAALQLGPPVRTAGTAATIGESSSASTQSETHRKALQEELAGIQAVIVIVNRDQPLSEHRTLLSFLETPQSIEDDAPALLSGFDLAVSLVVATPSPLQETVSLSTTSRASEVEDIYASAGWEYIDLAKEVDSYLDGEEGDEEEGEDGEKHGIERIREALMTHTWPGLTRKDDRRGRTEAATADDTGLDVDDGEGEIEQSLARLRSELDTVDEAAMAEPTEKDEELARAFLARIQATQLAANAHETTAIAHSEARPARSAADMQADLERFLESEDLHWPAANTNGVAADQEGAWMTDEQNVQPAEGTTFDDDFTDFVQADTTSDQRTAHGLAFDTDVDEDDVAAFVDEDDAILMRALAAAQQVDVNGSTAIGDDVRIDFESTLQAVLAHAERVRAIPDHEQRREEAARVALALLDQ